MRGRVGGFCLQFAGADRAGTEIDGPLADVAPPSREDGLVVGRSVLIESRRQLPEKLCGLLLADGGKRTEIGIRQLTCHTGIRVRDGLGPTIERDVFACGKIKTGKRNHQRGVAWVPLLPINEVRSQRLAGEIVLRFGSLDGLPHGGDKAGKHLVGRDSLINRRPARWRISP